MGVRVIEHDEAEDDCSACFGCAGATNKSTSNLSTNNHCDKTTSNAYNNFHESTTETLDAHAFTRSAKDLVGNSKEFRIDHNKCDLRVIGNGNRIRITGDNTGNLQIIGNGTRLKIHNNSGNIKYTGNDGRICLGSDSMQQSVDYIGCNGILKVVNSMELNAGGSKCKNKTKAATSTEGVNAEAAPKPQSKPLKVKGKSASYGGSGDCRGQWQQFGEMFQRHYGSRKSHNVSMPNLKENCNCPCSSKSKGSNKTNKKSGQNSFSINNNVNIVNNVGNINIQNSINVNI